jgi:hypothetical protein
MTDLRAGTLIRRIQDSNHRKRLTNDSTKGKYIMELPSSDMLEIDRDEKKITITNNRELYSAIKSGAIVTLFPLQETLAAVRTAAECVDPALAWITEFLTRVLEATYLHHALEWTVAHSVRIRAPTARATAIARTSNISTE